MPLSNQSPAAHTRQKELTLAPSTIETLKAELTAASEPVSLLAWKQRRPELAKIEDGIWLMNAYLQLKAAGFGVKLVSGCADTFEINEPFEDVELSPFSGR